MKIEISQFIKEYTDTCIKVDHIVIDERITLLVGKNGSGKSTIMKSLAKLIHYQGYINANPYQISYMCEQPNFPHDVNVMRFIQLLNNVSSNPRNDAYINHLLSTFQLFDKKDSILSELSKGMKAKVNLVQCLMTKADIYLLDEPLSGLDSESVNRLKDHILNSEKQFIISTHLLDDFKSLNPKVIEL
ncbi:MAG: ATP-binding cassette domain-containing protein [Bacilli bacterium]|nr:ATP-binding cassette domain-containing protein [Bacilli bacterium]